MTFAFVKTNKAFLPALQGYPDFFSRYNIKCEIVTKNELNLVQREVEWFFMGTDYSKHSRNICKIHEYISPSMPPYNKWKDLYKSVFNSQPDLRIFKNEYVRRSFNFKDKVACYYQDIGIDPQWLVHDGSYIKKEFDFIYIGELSERRKPELLIDLFTKGDLQQRTLLLLSKDYHTLQQKYRHYSNIIFKGPAGKEEVKNSIKKARFGINYIPDIAPFNQLTSTKFLEYAACGIPVITTNYQWIKKFQEEYKGNYFYLLPDLCNFTWDNIINYTYSFPHLQEWTWDRQLRNSGVLDFLQARFTSLDFRHEPASG